MSMLPGALRPNSRAIEIGTAAEHIVCADLILSGYRAFLSSQGLPYDVILDRGDKLFKIAVKSTLKPYRRPGRADGPVSYIFGATRSKRDNKGKTSAIRYTNKDADIIAFVALDIRAVAYAQIGLSTWHIFPPGSTQPEFDSLGRHNGLRRKRFEDFTLDSVLPVICENL